MGFGFYEDYTGVNYERGNQGREWIVIHYTGNANDTARGNANYFRSVYRGASAHFFVDESDVYQVVHDKDTAWAVGRNFGTNNLYGVCNNYNSISIEMCSRDGWIQEATFANTVQLTKNLMAQFGIDADHVVRHYDVCSKRCPGWDGWLPGDEYQWNRFKEALTMKEKTNNVQLWKVHNGDNQLWWINKLEDGNVYLVNKASGRALDMDVPSGNVQTWPWNGTDNQMWRLEEKRDEWFGKAYLLVNKATGKAMDCWGAGMGDGTNIDAYDTNGTLAQEWLLASRYDGTYVIISSLSGLALDADS